MEGKAETTEETFYFSLSGTFYCRTALCQDFHQVLNRGQWWKVKRRKSVTLCVPGRHTDIFSWMLRLSGRRQSRKAWRQRQLESRTGGFSFLTLPGKPLPLPQVACHFVDWWRLEATSKRKRVWTRWPTSKTQEPLQAVCNVTDATQIHYFNWIFLLRGKWQEPSLNTNKLFILGDSS